MGYEMFEVYLGRFNADIMAGKEVIAEVRSQEDFRAMLVRAKIGGRKSSCLVVKTCGLFWMMIGKFQKIPGL